MHYNAANKEKRIRQHQKKPKIPRVQQHRMATQRQDQLQWHSMAFVQRPLEDNFVPLLLLSGFENWKNAFLIRMVQMLY